MSEFKGPSAAIDAIRFALANGPQFLRLIGAWAAILFAATLAYCLVVRPAGPEASIAQQIAMFNDASSSRFVQLIPNLLGTLAVGVLWTKFVLTGRPPGNPFLFSGEMATYFVRSLQAGLSALLSLVPSVVLAVVLYDRIGGGTNGLILAWGIGGILAVATFCVVYGRLCLALPSAAMDEAMTLRGSFEVTAGYTVAMALGLAVSYLVPFAVAIPLVVAVSVLPEGGALADATAILGEAASDLFSFALVALVAGFQANAFRALAPGDPGEQVARTFE